MTTKETFRHFGFFEGEMAKNLFNKNADEIVQYLTDNPDDFTISEGEIDTDIDNPENEHDMYCIGVSMDGEYLVRYERGDNNNEGWYIDVYVHKVVQIPEDNEDGVYEFCPHCDNEVYLLNEFKVQKCPECGEYIVPCNLCPLLGENKCSGKCPLEELANQMNAKHYKEKYGTEYSTASFVSTFNSSTEKQWEKGFILTIFNDDGFIDIVLRIFYIKSLDTICFMNERDSDKGWFMREPKRLSIDYLEQVFEILDVPSNYKLYVKVLD